MASHSNHPRIPRAESILLQRISPSSFEPTPARSFSVDRLVEHRAVLESSGVTNLTKLGTLRLDGLVAPQVGVTIPSGSIYSGEILYRNTFTLQRLGGDIVSAAIGGGVAKLLSVVPPIASVQSSPPIVSHDDPRITPRPALDRPISSAIGNLSDLRVPVGPALNARLRSAPAASLLSAPLALVPSYATATGSSVFLERAYLAADVIDLTAGTTVVLTQNLRFLFVICNRLVVGNNVLLTWEQPLETSVPKWSGSADRRKPPKPDTPVATWLGPTDGSTGANGENGDSGGNGDPAPEVELWTLEMSGSPVFFLRGQDGFPGGRGQDGGDGGDGADGLPETYDWFGFCATGHGAGGNGGAPGRPGNGGPGGAGGHGGRLTIAAPQAVLGPYQQQGFLLSVDGGRGGVGGRAGDRGVGGSGGRQGEAPRNCRTSEPRGPGVDWSDPADRNERRGPPGYDGPKGPDGDPFPDAIRFLPITREEWAEELAKPAIETLSPTRVYPGDVVVAIGHRFLSGDVIELGGQIGDQTFPTLAAETVIESATRCNFKVPPNTHGGYQVVRIRRDEGRRWGILPREPTRSNRASLLVLPRIDNIEPSGRLTPGSRPTIIGAGFNANARVEVDGIDMAEVRLEAPTRLSFHLVRPKGIASNPLGERATLRVLLPAAGGIVSNSVTIVLDTYRIAVLGDSVLWGQGLVDSEKIHTHLEHHIRKQNPNIGIYTHHLAHSGAVIGVGLTGSGEFGGPIEGEVPTSFPTILQQASTINTPDTVDLVVLNGGINDVNFRMILNPFTPLVQIAEAVDRHCFSSMRTLLDVAARTFSNAKIIVVGYYAIVGPASNDLLIGPALASLGVSNVTPAGLDLLVVRSRLWLERSNAALRAAVDSANRTLGTDRIAFAELQWGDDYSMLSANARVFGLTSSYAPEGNRVINTDRAGACSVRTASGIDRMTCEMASVGHPNVAGAKAIAEAVQAVLDAWPPTDWIDALPEFPADFLFGVAVAGVQVEGNLPNSDWRAYVGSALIRDRLRRLNAFPFGNVVDRHATFDEPAEAVAHEDLQILDADLSRAAALGINAYRMSIEWSRVQPNPPGDPPSPADFDPAAEQYYLGAIERVRSRGMTPVVTLNHLTLPTWVLMPPDASAGGSPFALEDQGFLASLRGWESDATVTAFLRFVTHVVDMCGARVDWWLTFNEPAGSMIGAGYVAGWWCPGFATDGDRAKRAYFNIIRAHVHAYDIIKARRPQAKVGFAHAMIAFKSSRHLSPWGNNADAEAQADYFFHAHMLDAVIGGRVDREISRSEAHRRYDDPGVFFAGHGFDTNAEWRPRLDFIGVNYYRSVYAYLDAAPSVAGVGFMGGRFHNDLAGKDEPHYLLNSLGWETNPDGLYQITTRLHTDYGLPVLITENGMPETIEANRGAYVVAHLAQLARARGDGVDVRGYLYWTLLDNWEWLDGYSPAARFGLFHVDRGDGTDARGPRELGEAGVAFAVAICARSVRAAALLAGDISGDGLIVRAGRRSLAQFDLRLADGTRYHLIATRVSDDRFLSLMRRLTAGAPWVPVREFSWDRALAKVAFLAALPTGDARFAGQVSSDLILGHTDASGGQDFAATRVPLVGSWRSTNPLVSDVIFSHLSGEENSWRGRALVAAPLPSWVPLTDLSFDGTIARWTIVTSVFFSLAFTVTVNGPAMSGMIDGSSAWSAIRLDVDLFG